MKLDKKVTSAEMQDAHVSQAYFGRLVGVSAMRIGQLIREGLILVDGEGVKLLPSLRRYYGMRAVTWRGGKTVEDYLRCYVDDENFN